MLAWFSAIMVVLKYTVCIVNEQIILERNYAARIIHHVVYTGMQFYMDSMGEKYRYCHIHSDQVIFRIFYNPMTSAIIDVLHKIAFLATIGISPLRPFSLQ